MKFIPPSPLLVPPVISSCVVSTYADQSPKYMINILYVGLNEGSSISRTNLQYEL